MTLPFSEQCLGEGEGRRRGDREEERYSTIPRQGSSRPATKDISDTREGEESVVSTSGGKNGRGTTSQT